jgi:hypothetical protein
MSENEEILELGDDGSFDIPKQKPQPIAAPILTPPPPPEAEEEVEEEERAQLNESDFEPGKYKMYKEEKSILVILRTATAEEEVCSINVEDGTKLIVAVGGGAGVSVRLFARHFLNSRQPVVALALRSHC